MTKEQTDKIMALIDTLSKMLSIEEKIEENPAVETKDDPFIRISELNPGDEFKFSDYKWVLLGDEQGGKLAITKKIVGEYPFDEDNCNDWRKSSLRKFLNSYFLETLKKKDLMPFTSDLTSDDSLTNYESSEDFVFLISDALYRKYRHNMPKYDTWVWTITPYSTLPSLTPHERCVYPDGSLDYNYACEANGVAPAILLNPETKIKKINN